MTDDWEKIKEIYKLHGSKYKLSRKQLLGKGICPNCKCRPLLAGYRACERCKTASDNWMKENRERTNAYNKTRYESLKDQGLCTTCKLPSPNHVCCRTCTDKKNAYRALNRMRHSRDRWAKR